MKKAFFSVFTSLTAALVFAGGVENKTNMSTGYLRNPSRNTENQRPEAAFYNIAGTAFLEDGLYVEAGNQFVFKEYGNKLKSNTLFNMLEAGINNALTGLSTTSGRYNNDNYYNDETTVVLYPHADVVFKKANFAGFANFGVYAGGGSLSYSEGTSATELAFIGAAKNYFTAYSTYKTMGNNEEATKALGAATYLMKSAGNHSLDVNSITYGGQLGSSYKIIENLSLAAALRFCYGTQKLELSSPYFSALGNGGNTISYNADAFSFAGVFGIHYKPIENLDVSAMFSTINKLEYECKDVKGSLGSSFGVTNGKKFNTDLPAVLNLGAGYKFFEKLYVSGSFNYYFNKAADQDSVLGTTDYDDSWELAGGADYKFNDFISASCGIQYGKQGTNNSSNSTFNPVLDSFCIGGGVEIYPIKPLTITIAGMYCNYFNTDYYVNTYKTELKKDVTMLSLAVTYKFF